MARLEAVTYSYPGAASPALSDVWLEVDEGEFLLAAGPSAGGKSTLLRTFNGLVPQFHGGSFHGTVQVGGLDPTRVPARRMAHVAGMVFQEPEAQGVGATVAEDIAFGMEQQGIEPAEMSRRLNALLDSLGIGHLRDRQLETLSGGERQRAAIAAALALSPAILLCDEPTSQLDPNGAEAVSSALERLSGEGTAIVLAEHRLERFLPRADSVLAVEGGHVRKLAPIDAAKNLAGVPAFIEVARRAGRPALSVEEARREIDLARLRCASVSAHCQAPGDALLECSVSARYGERLALDNVELSVREGEVLAVMGANGSGKTTLLRAIAGLLKDASGRVAFRGSPAPGDVQTRSAFAGLVPQDPAVALFQETVREEVMTGLRFRKMRKPNGDGVLQRWGLDSLAAANPRDLSVGQQLRVAVASMLAHEPPVWLMDEPTRGADERARQWLAAALRRHGAAGGAAIVATHDVDAAASFATRVVGLKDARLEFDLPVREALGPRGPYPTSLSKVVPWAITLEDIA